MSPEWLKIFVDLGMSGLVMWVVVWIFQKTIPGLVKNFREELAMEREGLRAAVEGLRDDMRTINESLILNRNVLTYMLSRITGEMWDEISQRMQTCMKNPECPFKQSILSENKP